MNGFCLDAAQRRTYCRFADLPLPRHTSYPIVPAWKSTYRTAQFREALTGVAKTRRPLSLYIHIPYCQRLCYYCACTKEIVPVGKRRQHDPAEDFLRGLALEVGHLAPLLASNPVHQVQLGGGSPTFLHPGQLEQLWQILRNHFLIAPEAEIAVEIDPRITTREHLEMLRRLGFNRISLGIQDFAPEVQRAVNR
jgi:oxygen-independent coproporphyrinogen-3 oxidase